MNNMNLTVRQDMMSLIHQTWRDNTVAAAEALGIVPLLRQGVSNVAELALKTKVKEEPLSRLLRALSTLNIVHEKEGSFFSTGSSVKISPIDKDLFQVADLLHQKKEVPHHLGERIQTIAGKSFPLLNPASPQTLNAYARLITGPEITRAWQSLAYSIRTGEPSFQGNFYEYLENNNRFGEVFNVAMTQKYQGVVEEIVQSYDFAPHRTIVDVGGGYGHLLNAILHKHPSLKGVLFDIEKVIEGARERFKDNSRCRLIHGSGLESIPEGGDLYLMKSFMVMWGNDADAVQILRNCRKVMPADGKLLIIEPILLPPNQPDDNKFFDLQMLILHKGRLRTLSEYTKLLTKAGFTISSHRLTPSGFTILEGKPCQQLSSDEKLSEKRNNPSICSRIRSAILNALTAIKRAFIRFGLTIKMAFTTSCSCLPYRIAPSGY